MASIYKTSQSRFYFARFSDGSGSGKRISKSTKTESKREAKRIAAEFESAARKRVAKEAVDSEIPAMIRRTVELAALESQQGRLTLQRAEELIRLMHQAANPSDTGSSFRRFAGEWLDVKEKDTASTTWRAYSDAVKAACAILGSKADGPLRQITVADMERVQTTMAETRKGKTVNYLFGAIRRILESAVQKDIITKNPAKPVKGRPLGDSIKRVEFTAEEVRLLLAHAPTPEWYGLILLGAQTGLRQGDLLRLTSDNIVAGRIQILASDTSNDVLKIPLRPESLEWLKGRTGALFPELQATRQESRPALFSAIRETAGVAHEVILAAGDPPVVGTRSFHSLRHSFASWMAEADIHSDVRRKLTGHKSNSIHANYTHHDSALDRAVAALPDL